MDEGNFPKGYEMEFMYHVRLSPRVSSLKVIKIKKIGFSYCIQRGNLV